MQQEPSTQPQQDAAPPAALHGAMRGSTPTWEIELLLSGAVVFAMFQLPGVLDDAFDRYEARFSASWSRMLWFSYFYAKIVVFALISTFVAHLATRGFWVALIGLDSVYPQGVQWDKLRHGPNYVRATRTILLPLPELIARADNLASLVFTFGFLLVLMGVAAFVLTAALLAGSYALSFGVFEGRHLRTIMALFMAGLLLPLILAIIVDRTLGARLPREHPGSRILQGIFRAANWLTVGRLSQPMMLTYTSNVGRRKGVLLVLAGLYLLMGMVAVDALVRKERIPMDSYAFVPRTGQEGTVDSRHYARLRPEAQRYSILPFIQSDIITEPYVKLFIPYAPDRHTHAIRRNCVEVAVAATHAPIAEAANPAPADEQARRQLLACIAALHDVRLDGKAIKDLRLDFHTDPVSGLRGMLAYVPVRALAPGRHELQIARLPRSRDATLTGPRKPEPPDRIAFWR